MAPIRRYLRITKYSVLEVRIYLDNPADADSWLLKPNLSVLPRVIEAIRPLVLPKLREENENAKRKGGKKKKGVRDVLSRDDFEVSIFLTESSSTHSLLTKLKSFGDQPRLKSNSGKITPFLNTNDNPIHVEDDAVPAILQEEEAEAAISLRDIPEAATRKKRGHSEDHGAIFVNSDDDDDDVVQAQKVSRRKRKKVSDAAEGAEPAGDKKKLALSTAYEGFSIYGRVLCLIVKRKGARKPTSDGAPGKSSEMLENWVSTQAAQDGLAGFNEDG